MECLFSLLFFTFGHFNQVNSNTDKNDCKCLRPAKTVLSESKGSNGRHNQNQITVDSDDRCLQIFQTDRQQHITDSGRENQYEHQNKERRPMERHGEYRGIKSCNKRDYNGRHGSTGKGISQHRYRSNGREDALTKNQIDSIYHRAKKTKHISRESIGRQIITLLG